MKILAIITYFSALYFAIALINLNEVHAMVSCGVAVLTRLIYLLVEAYEDLQKHEL